MIATKFASSPACRRRDPRRPAHVRAGRRRPRRRRGAPEGARRPRRQAALGRHGQPADRGYLLGVQHRRADDHPAHAARSLPHGFTLFDTPTVLGFDGKQAWVKSAIFGAPEGAPIEDKWSRDVMLDSRFGSVLLDHAARGARIDYAGTDQGRRTADPRARGRACGSARGDLVHRPRDLARTKRVARIYDVFTGPDAEFEMDVFYMDYPRGRRRRAAFPRGGGTSARVTWSTKRARSRSTPRSTARSSRCRPSRRPDEAAAQSALRATSGSTRVARRAGSQQAAKAAPPSTAATAPNVAGSAGSLRRAACAGSALARARRAGPHRRPRTRSASPARQPCEDVAPPGPKRQADRRILPSAAHPERHHAVDPHPGRGGRRQQTRPIANCQTLAGQRLRHQVVHAAHVEHRQVRVEFACQLADRRGRGRCRRIACCPHGQVRTPAVCRLSAGTACRGADTRSPRALSA